MKKALPRLSLLLVLSLIAGCTPRTSSETPSTSTEPPVSTSVSAEVSSEELVSSETPTPSETPSSEAPVSSEVPVSSESPSSEAPVPAIIIDNDEEDLWVGDNLQLDITVENTANDAVTYASSDEDVATVDETGKITALSEGYVIITVTLVSDNTVKATLSLLVKDTILDTNFGFGNIDYSHIKDEKPYILTTKENTYWPYVEGVFRNVLSQKYYAEAVFTPNEINEGWVWNRMSLGHRDKLDDEAGHKFRGLALSYGNGNPVKIVMKEGPDDWGDTTDRSQVWGLNNLNNRNIGIDKPTKLATLRDGNKYYYFLNDELMWMEQYDTRFLDVDTAPTILLHDVHAKVSDMAVITDSAVIDALVNSDEVSRLVYSTLHDNVILAEDGSVEFINNEAKWPFDNIKDNSAKSLGDAFSLPAVDASVSFDYKVNNYADPDLGFLGITLQRWSHGPNAAMTFRFGIDKAGFNTWDANGDLPVTSSVNIPYKSDRLETNSVKIERIITEGVTSFNVYLNGEKLDFDWAGGEANYAGPYTMWLNSKITNGIISNYKVELL